VNAARHGEAPSSSGPVEAPVNTLTWNFSPCRCASAIRRANSIGTALGYPEPVNPLIPTWSPEPIRAAASVAVMIFWARAEFSTRTEVGDASVTINECLSCK
jgi:hypothetical protein